MSLSDEAESCVTHVGRVSPSELHFRGSNVADLLGLNYLQLISLSLGGPKLDAAACEVVDRLTTCMLAADPRIWPLKLVQLAACHGRSSSGLGVGVITMEPSALSYWSAGPAARLFQKLAADLDGQPLRSDLASRTCAEVPPGFGVHGRDVDYRVTLFREWRRASGTSAGAYECLANELEPYVTSAHQQRLRIDGLVAAALLDLGFAPEQVGVFSGVVQALPSILANAHEGSLRGPALRELAPSLCVYRGRYPCVSQRSRNQKA